MMGNVGNAVVYTVLSIGILYCVFDLLRDCARVDRLRRERAEKDKLIKQSWR